MFLTEENEKKAYDAMQKMQALDAVSDRETEWSQLEELRANALDIQAGEWDKLTEEDLFWSLIHCVYEQ